MEGDMEGRGSKGEERGRAVKPHMWVPGDGGRERFRLLGRVQGDTNCIVVSPIIGVEKASAVEGL